MVDMPEIQLSRPLDTRGTPSDSPREADEERPVGFVGVEQRPDAVVGKPAEPEGDALDAIVDRLGGTPVADSGAVPVHDRDVPAGQGPTQTAQLRRAVGIGEIVRKFAEVGAGKQGAVDVIEAAEGFPAPAWEAAVMRAGRRWHRGAGH